MSTRFDEIVIIYNPNSTGDGKKNANDLQNKLYDAGFGGDITLRTTEHAGHAEEMAAEYAQSTKQMLLVSSSGDGGYNELINGVLKSPAKNITVGVLPSGNANDHYNSVAGDSDEFVDRCIDGGARNIDVLKVTAKVDGKPWERYAHSYVGFGLSPTIGRELTKADLNVFKEKVLLLKYLFRYSHATLLIGGQKKRFSSLVFSNIDQMSKMIKLSKSSVIDDGKFEVSSVEYQPKWRVILLLIKSATIGLDEIGSYKSYEFKTTRKTLVQLDGEVFKLDGNCNVNVDCELKLIQSIL